MTVTIDDDDGGGGTDSTSSDATLRALALSSGELPFNSATTRYEVDVAHDVASVTLTPTVNYDAATVAVNDDAVTSGTPSAAITLEAGNNIIEVVTRAVLAAGLALAAAPAPAEGGPEVTVTAALDGFRPRGTERP